MRKRLLFMALGMGTVLTGVMGGFIVGRRWPISSAEEYVNRFRPAALAEALLPWRVTDTIPETRYENGRVLIGRELFFFGGFYNEATQATRRVDILDLDTHQWRRGADTPEAVTHGNAVVMGDTAVWFAGGFVGDHPGPPTTHTWRYRVPDNEWIAGPDLPAPRGGGGLARIGDTLHYFGGWLVDRNTGSTDHWRLRPSDTVWEPRAPMPLPRGHVASVAIGGTFWALGGSIGHDPSPVDIGVIHRYDAQSDHWSEERGLVRPRSHSEPGTILWRDRVLLVGGRNNPGSQATIPDIVSWSPTTGRERYEGPLPMALLAPTSVIRNDTLIVGAGAPYGNNPTNKIIWRLPMFGCWYKFPRMPLPLGEVSAAVLGDRLFLVGEGDGKTLALDLRTGQWDAATQWNARPLWGNHHAAEVLNGKWVLIGGLGNADIGRLVQRFDPTTNQWSMGPSLPIPIGASASGVIHGQLYVVGGISGDHTVGDSFVLDSTSQQWRPIAPMPKPRNHAASATDGERLWVFGGRGPGSGDSNIVANGYADVQVYDPRTNSWSISSDSPDSPMALPQARGGMGKAVFLDGEFWVMGGETKDGAGATANDVYDRVDIYNPMSRKWRLGPPLRTPRHGIFPVLDDGRILIAGGGTRAAWSVSDVVEVLRPR